MKKSQLLGNVCRFIIVAASLWMSNATATTIIVPNAPHEGYNANPFGLSVYARYQQVFDSSVFGSEPVSIQSLAFSPSTVGTYSANIQIRLTTTTTTVGALSGILDDNFTTPLTTVLSDSSFSQAISSSGSESFSLSFDISDFLYNPSAGNLLLDIVISDTSGPSGFSRAGANETSSRAYSQGFSGNADDVALRTQITFAAVPVPAAVWLFGSGLLGLTGLAIRKVRI